MAEVSSQKLLLALKLLAFGSCSYLFYILTYKLFINYQSNKVIVTSASQKLGTVSAPVVMLCSENGFLDYNEATLNLNSYMETTVNVTEKILMNYTTCNSDAVRHTSWTFTEIFTAYNGHCLALTTKEQVLDRDDKLGHV